MYLRDLFQINQINPLPFNLSNLRFNITSVRRIHGKRISDAELTIIFRYANNLIELTFVFIVLLERMKCSVPYA